MRISKPLTGGAAVNGQVSPIVGLGLVGAQPFPACRVTNSARRVGTLHWHVEPAEPLKPAYQPSYRASKFDDRLHECCGTHRRIVMMFVACLGIVLSGHLFKISFLKFLLCLNVAA
jgi:hypothetical protein